MSRYIFKFPLLELNIPTIFDGDPLAFPPPQGIMVDAFGGMGSLIPMIFVCDMAF